LGCPDRARASGATSTPPQAGSPTARNLVAPTTSKPQKPSGNKGLGCPDRARASGVTSSPPQAGSPTARNLVAPTTSKPQKPSGNRGFFFVLISAPCLLRSHKLPLFQTVRGGKKGWQLFGHSFGQYWPGRQFSLSAAKVLKKRWAATPLPQGPAPPFPASRVAVR